MTLWPQSSRRASYRLVAGMTVLVVLTAATACGQGSEPGDSATTSSTAVSGSTTTASTAPVQRSAPRWETVTTIAGTGSETTERFSILPGAIQWRARWTCEAGHMVVSTIPPPRRPKPMIDSTCQGKDAAQEKAIGYSIITGKVQLAIEVTGPWEITVDQQVDTPLIEPPLPGMAAAKVLGQGDLYDVEMKGTGIARIYQLPDGSRALRLENLEVSNNTDLFVWLSESPSPKTSAEAVAAPHVVLGNLKSTLGSENHVLPSDLAPDRIRSIVIWCEPVRIAYAAAILDPPS